MVDSPLLKLISAESGRAAFPAAQAVVDDLCDRYGAGVRAVVFYGSCLRLGTDENLMLDFYVLVDRLSDALSNPVSAAFGTVLPPNVYYHEVPFEGRTVRAKVAVMTLGAFARGTADSAFTPALWARFAQPAAVVYASDSVARSTVQAALTRAVLTLVSKTLPLMTGPFSVRDLWIKAFRATYGAELRPEGGGKAAELVDADPERYETVGMAALTELGVDPSSPRFARTEAKWIWRLRSIWGRLLNVLRLIKAAFTFQGGLDYAVWKLERHSGENVILTDEERARPLRTGLRLTFRAVFGSRNR